jgi:Ca2+-binding EF-hand superfamily protein
MKTKSPGPRQVTQTFKLLDKNRDGKINFEEIKEVLSVL